MRKENTKGTQLVIYTMQNLINMKEVTRKFKRPLSIHRKMRYKDSLRYDKLRYKENSYIPKNSHNASLKI